MTWRVAESLDQLRDQIDTAHPYRDKTADGTIGDANHATKTSDHNPWVKDGITGVVTAIDVTHDPAHGVDALKIVNAIVASKDKRVKYLIHNGRIWRAYDKPGIPAWTSAPYIGPSPHAHHFHLSVQPTKSLFDSRAEWKITLVPPKPKGHAPPWQLLEAGKVTATGRLSNPLFVRKVAAGLVRRGKVTLRDAP